MRAREFLELARELGWRRAGRALGDVYAAVEEKVGVVNAAAYRPVGSGLWTLYPGWALYGAFEATTESSGQVQVFVVALLKEGRATVGRYVITKPVAAVPQSRLFASGTAPGAVSYLVYTQLASGGATGARFWVQASEFPVPVQTGPGVTVL